MTKTFEHDPAQEAVIRQFSNFEQSAGLNGSGTGVGKTYIAVKTAHNRMAKRVLIIAPPNTFDNWEETVQAIAGVQLRPCGNQKIGDHKAPVCKVNMEAAQAGEDGWFFVGREMFNLQNWAPVMVTDKKTGEKRPKLTDKGKKVVRRLDIWGKRKPFDFTAFDEVQICSDIKARTRQSWAHLQITDSYSTPAGPCRGFRLAQSADFFGSRLENIYTVTEDLWPGHSGMNRTEWMDEYFEVEYDHYSFGHKKIKGEKWEGFYVSTLPNYAALPSPIDKPIPEFRTIDMSPAQTRLYEQLQEDLAAEIEGNTLIIDMDMHLTMRLRELTLGLFHVVETTKKDPETGLLVPATTIDYRPGDPSTTVDEIKRIHAEHDHEPMLVLTHSKKFAIKAAIDLGGLPYTGDQSDAEKIAAKEALLSGKTKILVGTQAICEGLDGLQEVCRLSVIASRVWAPYKNQQFLGRTARRGQKRPVLAYEIMRRGTIDKGVVSRILKTQLKLNKAKAMEEKGGRAA